MLNKNFATLCLAMITTDTSGKGNDSLTITGTDGNDFVSGNGSYNKAGNMLNVLAKLGTTKRGSITNTSTFSIGSGTTAATFDDYTLETPIDESDFTISAASMTKSGSRQNSVFNQIWQYNGNSSITINEIGLFTAIYGNSQIAMVDRTVLESPITVNNGDTFTIALTIGGKAVVTVNS